jgi:Cu(I)/Ag(I) efflux system membrane fusion protein
MSRGPTPERRGGRDWTRPVLVLVAIAAGWLLRGALGPASPPEGPSAEQQATQAAEEWTCSMHPQIRLPRPGPCPICEMDLVPVTTGTVGDDPRRIRIGPEARERMRLATSPVERRSVEATIRMVGKIVYDETRVATITARVAGRIERLFVDYAGIEVKEGEHLVALFSPKLYAAQAELFQALAAVRALEGEPGADPRRVGTASATLDASRERLQQLGLTRAQIEAVEESGTPSDEMTILAPIGGIVLQKDVRQGMYLKEGTRIGTIADLDHLWVVLDAHESDLMWLRYGQHVEFTTPSHPGEVFEGTIAFIAPVLDDRTRTIKVRVNVSNEERRLKPNMFVKAVVRPRVAAGGRVMDPNLAGKWICPMHPEIVREEEALCSLCEMELVTTESLGYVPVESQGSQLPLVIPATAALVTGKRAIVFVEVPDSDALEYEGREVSLGPRAGEWIIVRGGLEEGESSQTETSSSTARSRSAPGRA